jgi:hypothetical protein
MSGIRNFDPFLAAWKTWKKVVPMKRMAKITAATREGWYLQGFSETSSTTDKLSHLYSMNLGRSRENSIARPITKGGVKGDLAES